jgi:S-formylglutathione hydrolase FrmB
VNRFGRHAIVETNPLMGVRASGTVIDQKLALIARRAIKQPPRRPARIVSAVVLALAALASLSPTGAIRAEAFDRLQTVSIKSTALKAVTTVNIFLPAAYADGTRRYPVLYLYHGLGGSNFDWIYNTDIEKFTQNLPVIIVMPDAGSGWYVNPANPQADSPHWEDYHIGELIPYIDGHYRTIATRAGRAVAGFSMGGMGAFSYAARHPDLFVAAASFSGALDLSLETNNIGSSTAGSWYWSGHDPVELAGNLAGLTVYLASGNGSPGSLDPAGTARDDSEATKLVEFKHMVTALQSAHVAATLDAYGPGTHTFPYFQRAFHKALPLIMATFAHPPAAPAAWSYRTTESQFAVWGYHGARQGGLPGWTVLTAVSRTGLSASGPGKLLVTTAPLYKPHSDYLITGPSSKARIQADSNGRLTLSLSSAPKTLQHWTIAATS